MPEDVAPKVFDYDEALRVVRKQLHEEPDPRMTVRDLIAELSKYSGDLLVYIDVDSEGTTSLPCGTFKLTSSEGEEVHINVI